MQTCVDYEKYLQNKQFFGGFWKILQKFPQLCKKNFWFHYDFAENAIPLIFLYCTVKYVYF